MVRQGQTACKFLKISRLCRININIRFSQEDDIFNLVTLYKIKDVILLIITFFKIIAQNIIYLYKNVIFVK